MLQSPVESSPLQQGDIIEGVPFLVLPKAVAFKVQGVQGQTRLDAQNPPSLNNVRQFAGGKPLVAAEVPVALQLGMVVTQSCDLDYKDHITLARVFPLAQFIQEAKDALEANEPLVLFDLARRLTEGTEHHHLIYLGNLVGQGPEVADLLRVQSFPKDWKEFFRQHRLQTLTDEWLKYLQGRLTTFVGRFATVEGFWQTEEDHKLAQQAKGSRGAIREAYDRLAAKRKK